MLHFIRLCLKLLGSQFDLLDALCWVRKFLRHSPSQLSNGIADFFTHLKVHLVRKMLTLDIVPSKLFFCLRSSKQVCG